MYLKSWDETAEEVAIKFQEVNTSACKQNNLNDVEGSNSESKFFKTALNSQKDLDRYGTSMKCSTDDLTEIYGNYDTYITQNLMIVFEKCTNSTDSNEIVCRSEDEI